MELIDNISRLLGDDLKQALRPGARLKIAASCFSMYAFEALKTELENIDELNFIFTSPTFVANEVTDKIRKERKEFHIPKLDRERSLYGSEFEIQLRNKLTQRAVAKECADWIRRKASFRSNRTKAPMQQFACVRADDLDAEDCPPSRPRGCAGDRGVQRPAEDAGAASRCAAVHRWGHPVAHPARAELRGQNTGHCRIQVSERSRRQPMGNIGLLRDRLVAGRQRTCCPAPPDSLVRRDQSAIPAGAEWSRCRPCNGTEKAVSAREKEKQLNRKVERNIQVRKLETQLEQLGSQISPKP